ncbi:MAG: hypothetical protein ACRC3B_21825 [Bacteroidia bacterium]
MRKANYSYQTNKFKIELENNSFIKLTFFENVIIEEGDVKLIAERVKWLTNGWPHFLLIDLRGKPVFSDQVQLYAASMDDNDKKMAEAIIVNSSWQARAGNFYSTYLRKKHYVQRFFYSKEKAVSWLMKQMPAQ